METGHIAFLTHYWYDERFPALPYRNESRLYLCRQTGGMGTYIRIDAEMD